MFCGWEIENCKVVGGFVWWCREVSILALVKSGSCVWKFPSKQNVPNVSAGIASRSSYMSVQLGLSWKMSDVSVVISGISLRVVVKRWLRA